MSTISIGCVDQTLQFLNMPIISSGDQNIDSVQFDLGDEWDGFIKVAVFFQQKGEFSYSLVDEITNTCAIPNSILRLTGKIFIGLTGTNSDNQVITTTLLSYRIADGIADASIQDEFPGEISEEEKNDVYNRMFELVENMKALVDKIYDRSVYLSYKGANEFEYDESKLDAKIDGYLGDKVDQKIEDDFESMIDEKIEESYATQMQLWARLYCKQILDENLKDEIAVRDITVTLSVDPSDSYTLVANHYYSSIQGYKLITAIPNENTNMYHMGDKIYDDTNLITVKWKSQSPYDSSKTYKVNYRLTFRKIYK